eukprot:TRINITY_DN9826_c0_g1_i1.p2 TRINITY_DN9826_c0_g1~~TRINITY_DN9826_c0_g1_i1.p2  ORF type:complete len:474 (-),score=39.92 TRINITY_DN9826_c0_g1_i1:2378-3799(-)
MYSSTSAARWRRSTNGPLGLHSTAGFGFSDRIAMRLGRAARYINTHRRVCAGLLVALFFTLWLVVFRTGPETTTYTTHVPFDEPDPAFLARDTYDPQLSHGPWGERWLRKQANTLLLRNRCTSVATPHQIDTLMRPQVHVGMIVVSVQVRSDLNALLRSIVFYRSCSVTLHLIVDVEGQYMAQELLNDIPEASKHKLYVKFYDYAVALTYGNQINDRFRFPCAFKASPERILFGDRATIDDMRPDDADHLLLIDLDSVSVDDVCDVHDVLLGWDDTQMLAYSPLSSPWFLTHTFFDAPMVGKFKGFNAGIGLFNLTRLRRMDWHAMWNKVMIEHYDVGLHTGGNHTLDLGDQDIVNVMAYHFPQYFSVMPGGWNYQLQKPHLDVAGPDYKLHTLHGNNRAFQHPENWEYRLPYDVWSDHPRLVSRLSEMETCLLRLRIPFYTNTLPWMDGQRGPMYIPPPTPTPSLSPPALPV